MEKTNDLSDSEKGMIIGFLAKGGSISETAKFVNCSRAAVVKVYRDFTDGKIGNKPYGTCRALRDIDVRGELKEEEEQS